MNNVVSGHLRKMTAHLGDSSVVQYQLPVGENSVELNPLIGQTIKLEYTGNISCSNCGRKTKKSYSQGFCFPCMQKLAQCDMCIMKPETCHFSKGTCREPDWAEKFCMTDHYVYLSNTSGIKVGITRSNQIPTRWIDQGATQGLPIFKVKTRQQSGLIEVALAKHIADKTNWRAMLKGNAELLDLKEHSKSLIKAIEDDLAMLISTLPEASIERLDEDITELSFPVTEFPTKVSSLNFDKTPEIEGNLIGIKGQYLILDTGVLNIRKFSSYEVQVSY